MRIDRIRLVDFRSFSEKTLEPEGLTLLVGPNASGKTNFIEAVRLATATTSFRRPQAGQVVREGAGRAVVEVDALGDSTRAEIRLEVKADGTRTYLVNGRPQRRMSAVASIVPGVVFTPDDLRMVKDGAETRRNTLDAFGSALWDTYGTLSSDYSRVVRQRNRLLREGANRDRTAPWTEQTAEKGGRLLSLRTRLLSRLAPEIQDAYEAISGGEGLKVDYLDSAGLPSGSWVEGVEAHSAARAIEEALRSVAAEEARRGLTLVGPHRDDVVFEVAGREARAFASQGQQRSIALAWKIAELRVMQQVTRRRPILLLDDVMSELDERRRAALASLVGEETQTFITTTNLGYFDEQTLLDAAIVELP